jgi:hypothetical protein
MRRLSLHLSAAVVAVVGLVAVSARAEDWTAGMREGMPAIKSMGPLTFGPEGILFAGDTKSAAVWAIATGDVKPGAGEGKPLKVEAIDRKVAALLGTTADQVLIDDVSVNPLSGTVYLAVSRGRGPDAVPVLVRVGGDGTVEVVKLDKVKFAKAELPDAPVEGVVGEGRRESNPRQESITDLAFLEDRVVIAGLSNEEFSSTLRAIPFPFKTVAGGTSVEIYHGAHGRFETRAPVRTLVPFNVGNEPNLLAAYTCTPLVQFPIKQLQPGAKIRGKTVAELGNRNRPLDMIVYQKDGKDYLLLANSSRGVMKISADDIENVEGIETPVGGGGTRGLHYETVRDWTGIEHLDKLDGGRAVVLRRGADKALSLESLPLP